MADAAEKIPEIDPELFTYELYEFNCSTAEDR